MYQMNMRVRYSEVDERNQLKLISILDYFQDCCTFESDETGLGIVQLKERGQAWMLASWQIIVEKYPMLGDEITVCTIPYEFKGFYGFRNLLLKDQAGGVLAYANSNWIFVDTKTGKPMRIPPEVGEVYQLGEPYPMECAPRKIRIPQDLQERESIRVHRFFIDSNHHVNNGKYVLAAENFLPKDFWVRELRVEYKKAAQMGDVFYPWVEEREEKITVVLADEEKSPYAVIEFFGGNKNEVR